MQLISAGHSIVGRRANNEDAFFVGPGLGLYVVADGMGGYEGGEVASAIVVHSLHDFFHRNRIDGEATWPFREDGSLGPLERMVDVGLKRAHRDVLARKHGRLARMGSTAVVAAFHEHSLVVGNLGDSRLYRLRGGQLLRLTRDHSVAEELARHGERVAGHFQHCLTRAVGMDDAPRCDLARHDVCPGDRYLLCTDGLWDALPEPAIADLLADDPLPACDHLVRAALAAGSRDNITAVVVAVQREGRIP